MDDQDEATGDDLVTRFCACGDYEVQVSDGEVDMDVICPECGNHFGQGTGHLAAADEE
jgi:hypothetical protein